MNCILYTAVDKEITCSLCVVFRVGEDNLEFIDFHEPDHVVVGDVCEYPVFVEVINLHDCSFLDEEEVLAFGPGVLGRVAVNLSLLQELLILLIELYRDELFLRRVLAFVQEEVVVLILLVYLFLEEVLDLFQVGQGVHIGDFVLLRVVVDLVVVEFMVVADGRRGPLQQGLALHQQVGQDVVLAHFSQLH